MMATGTRPKQSKGRDGVLSALDVAIETLNLAKEISSITPAKAVFGSASVLLAMIRVGLLPFCRDQPWFTSTQDSVANEADFVELGLFCAEVCEALDDGLKDKRLDEIAQSVLRAIGKLTTLVESVLDVTSNGRLTDPSVSGLWPRFRGRLSSWANEIRCLESSMGRAIKRRLPLGGRSSTVSFTSSMYVQFVLFRTC